VNKAVIGCDPGAKGAMCLLWISDTDPTLIQFIDHKQDVQDIFNWLTEMERNVHISTAILEDVHSLFGMSAKSNFNFGKNLGIVETLLKLQDFPLETETVQPKVWQKSVGVDIPKEIKGPKRSKAIKARVAELCEKLYPGCKIWGPKGGLMDGRSDALMIAHYCLTNLGDNDANQS